MKTVNKICPALYRALSSVISKVTDVRKFSSPEALLSIEKWTKDVAWRLAAEETIALSSLINLSSMGESRGCDNHIVDYSLRGGRPPSPKNYSYFRETYPLLSIAFEYHSPYFIAYCINSGKSIETFASQLTNSTMVGKAFWIKIISEVRVRQVVKECMDLVHPTIIRAIRTKILSLTKKNKNGICGAIVAEKSFISLVTRNVDDNDYFSTLICHASVSQKNVLATHQRILCHPVATLTLVESDQKLWTYCMCGTIRGNYFETFQRLLVVASKESSTIMMTLAYTPLISALSSGVKNPMSYTSNLCAYFPLAAVFFASDLRVSSDIMQLLTQSLSERGLLTSDAISELTGAGYTII